MLTRMKACLPVQDLEGPQWSVRRSGPGLGTRGRSLSSPGPWCPCFYKRGVCGRYTAPCAGGGPHSVSSRRVSPFPCSVLRDSFLLSLAGLAPVNSVYDSTSKLFTVSRADAVSAGVTTNGCCARCVIQHCTLCSMALSCVLERPQILAHPSSLSAWHPQRAGHVLLLASKTHSTGTCTSLPTYLP